MKYVPENMHAVNASSRHYNRAGRNADRVDPECTGRDRVLKKVASGGRKLQFYNSCCRVSHVSL